MRLATGNLHYCLYTKNLVDYQVSIENHLSTIQNHTYVRKVLRRCKFLKRDMKTTHLSEIVKTNYMYQSTCTFVPFSLMEHNTTAKWIISKPLVLFYALLYAGFTRARFLCRNKWNLG